MRDDTPIALRIAQREVEIEVRGGEVRQLRGVMGSDPSLASGIGPGDRSELGELVRVGDKVLEPAVDLFRIADLSQSRLKNLRATFIAPFFNEIVRLMGVGCEIE